MIHIGNFPSTKEFSMKPNRFLLMAILGLALAFTFFSCSSDDGGGGAVTACKRADYFNGDGIEHCSEISGEAASKHRDEIKEECEEDGGKFYDACPSGYKLKCLDDDQYVYLYTDRFKDCKEFLDWLN